LVTVRVTWLRGRGKEAAPGKRAKVAKFSGGCQENFRLDNGAFALTVRLPPDSSMDNPGLYGA
jgi:hypothetical protein